VIENLPDDFHDQMDYEQEDEEQESSGWDSDDSDYVPEHRFREEVLYGTSRIVTRSMRDTLFD
jgi:hypothetical protein